MNLKNQIINQLRGECIIKLAPSKIEGAGVGAFALCPISKGTVVFRSTVNEFIKWSEVPDLNGETIHHIKSVCNHDNEGFWMDCLPNNIYSAYYVNHSVNPNLFHDKDSDVYFALTDIKKGEELTCRYTADEIDWT